MNRAERIQRIDELADKGSDLGSFTASRMEFSELLFRELSKVLNDVHQMNASLRFWKLVVEEHLLAEVLRKDVLRETEWQGKPERYAIVNFSNFPTTGEKIRNVGGHIYRYLKTKKIKDEIDQKLRNHHQIYIGFGNLPLMDKEDKEGVKIPHYYPYVGGRADKGKRAALNNIADRYDSRFLKNVIRRIPKVYIEYFDSLYNSVNVYEPQKKTLHIHMTQSLFDTMMTARYTEEGARLIWYQHGCYYGEVIHKYRGYFEHSTGDLFRTWGYTDHEIDEPWSAYRLEAFKRKLPRNGEATTYDLMICYADIGGDNRKRVINDTDYLLNTIDNTKYQQILARPRPVNSRVKASSLLEFIADDRVTIAPDGSSIAQQVGESRILLQMRVPSTNFLECIYCDQPVIGLLENDQPTEIVKPYYTFFLNEGILHRDIESAAKFLNEVDVKSWWSNIKESYEYKSYKNKFTNTERFKKPAAL